MKSGTHRHLLGNAVCALALATGCVAFPAFSQPLSERLAAGSPMWDIAGVEIQAGGSAQAAFLAQSQPGQRDASGLASANIRGRKIFDNGMILSARADFLLYRDALSGDNYGGDTVQKLYLSLQTGFGRLDIGQQDGASSMLALRGPVTDSKINLADRGIAPFRDPATGGAFAGSLSPRIGAAASSNYAKFAYTAPRLFGLQAGFSYTPEALRTPLPFTGNPTAAPNGQRDIVEGALSYAGYFGSTAAGLSVSYVHGSRKNAAPGFADLSEWSVGTQIVHSLDTVKLAVGGGYRRTNAYLLDIGQAIDGRETGIAHLAASAEWGSWIFGVEHSLSGADGPVDYRTRGTQITAAYRLNANVQISAGWQWFHNRRDTGVFFNGLSRLNLDSGFLTLSYTL